MRTIRKAVAGMLAFIIGISILVVAIIPLLLYLNNSNAETLRAMGVVRDTQSQRSLESADVVYQNGDYWIKNTGPIPITIMLAVIDIGTGCGQGAALLKTSINLNPGDTIKNISSYGLGGICYIATSRGNVFPVKEKYLSLLAQSPQGTSFSPSNVWFANDMASVRKEGSYHQSQATCNTPGDAKIYSFSRYENRSLLTIYPKNSNNPVSYSSQNGCFNIVFINAVGVNGTYAVAVYYKIVLILNSKGNKLAVDNVTICLQGAQSRCSTYGQSSWNPSSLPLDYIALEGVSLVPMSNVPQGIYNLSITLTLETGGNTDVSVGIEYIAMQGAQLISG